MAEMLTGEAVSRTNRYGLDLRQLPATPRPSRKTPPSPVSRNDKDRHLFKVPDAELLDHVRRHVRDVQQCRDMLEAQWVLNLEFVAGNQWAVWDSGLRRIALPKRTPNDVRLVANRLKRSTYTILGHLLSAQVDYITLPAGRTREHRQRARVAEQVLHYLDRTLDQGQINIELYLWAIICGTAVIKTTWDPFAGNPYDEQNVREALAEKNVVYLDPSRKVAPVYEGQVRREVVTPFDIYPNVSARSPREVSEVVEIYRVHIDEARRQYPKFADYFQTDSAPDEEQEYSHLQGGYSNLFGGAPTPDISKTVTLYEYRRFRTHDYPRGLRSVTTRHFVISRSPVERRNPYEWLRYYVMPGRIWGQGMPDDAIPVQTEINAMRSIMAQWARSFSAPQWKVPMGSVNRDWKPQNVPNGTIPYKPLPMAQNGPTPVEMPPMPPASVQHLAVLDDEMKIVTGVEDALRAKAEFSGESGRYAAIRMEAASIPFIPFQMSTQSVHRGVALTSLGLVRENYTEDRTIRLYGKDGVPEVLTFLGTDLDEEIELELTREAFGTNRAVRRQEIIAAWNANALLDAEGKPDIKALRKGLEFGETRDVYRTKHEAENDAYEQALLLLDGTDVEADKLEDHEVHIEVKRDEYLSAKREGALTPIGAALINKNIMQHMGFHQQEVVAQLQALQAAGAGGGQPRGQAQAQSAAQTDVEADAQQMPLDGGMARQDGVEDARNATEAIGR